MIEDRVINFMSVRMNAWTMRETVDEIFSRLKYGLFSQHVVVNVAKLVNMGRDDVLRESVESCDIINIDGMGIVWGARFLGFDVPERVAGFDLFHELLGRAASEGEPVFLLGARQEVLEKAVQNLNKQFPKLEIAGYHHGYFWDDEEAVVNEIAASGAKLLFVAISSPRKENFINRWRQQLGVNFVMGVGGTFDIVAGKSKRAPKVMQKYGLEWFYRFLQEPRRMWKRYLVTNTVFALKLLRAKLLG
ncbi:WecB/TagA/CpsF family glycosyltransferase [Maridesulfovibrio hydrothermalis]|uniref:N-acetylmannosaminyltransferase n=1 Tax=Maridesulfovibrio hydrothermalis AM13 = DSM 14728 TaxID=1121451 RepID=L0R967_9BACT|nr:WecB/TagA/CpsF family glycosyltransferase [Maridesulfovibrio hydrothermalis]CCO23303.1 N-acetylmannosaminyltransferase [Maridesulfovibrio hydrothermalis AM13 = DSM 14728]